MSGFEGTIAIGRPTSSTAHLEKLAPSHTDPADLGDVTDIAGLVPNERTP